MSASVAVVEAPISKLTKDLKLATKTLGRDEARFLVDAYYSMQEQRIRSGNQVRSLTESGEPNEVLVWFGQNSDILENQVKSALKAYASSQAIGQWSLGITGIGPVIAAGLLAHIDITKAPTVGHIWRYAGLDPTVEWKKGEKRPWNASLKTLCWKIGESFVKVSSNVNDVYGKVYLERKAEETLKNESGAYAATATAELLKKNYGKTTEAYKAYNAGMLPLARIHARAKRYAVKLFLSHWHHVAYETHYGIAPPKPYIIDIGGHAHFIKPPNWPV